VAGKLAWLQRRSTGELPIPPRAGTGDGTA
jgi:hypothetical protein